MPTGYTAALHDDEEQSFTEFVMSCARGMGALITMRDEPKDAPIPTEFKANTTYYDSMIAETTKKLEAVKAMTAAEADQGARAELETTLLKRAAAEQDRLWIKRRYEEMKEQVEAWTPPTVDHFAFKKFMLEQLDESIRFDCSLMDWPPVPELTGKKWRTEKMARLERNLAHYTESRDKEIARASQRTAWVQALVKSLPQ